MRLKDFFKIKNPPENRRLYRVSIYVAHSKSFIEKAFKKPEQALKYAVNYARGHKPDANMTKFVMSRDVKDLDFDNLLVSRDNWDLSNKHSLQLNYISDNHQVILIQLWPLKTFLKFLS